jgi:hypothetical protein
MYRYPHKLNIPHNIDCIPIYPAIKIRSVFSSPNSNFGYASFTTSPIEDFRNFIALEANSSPSALKDQNRVIMQPNSQFTVL